jgi:hypothetical protein
MKAVINPKEVGDMAIDTPQEIPPHVLGTNTAES